MKSGLTTTHLAFWFWGAWAYSIWGEPLFCAGLPFMRRARSDKNFRERWCRWALWMVSVERWVFRENLRSKVHYFLSFLSLRWLPYPNPGKKHWCWWGTGRKRSSTAYETALEMDQWQWRKRKDSLGRCLMSLSLLLGRIISASRNNVGCSRASLLHGHFVFKINISCLDTGNSLSHAPMPSYYQWLRPRDGISHWDFELACWFEFDPSGQHPLSATHGVYESRGGLCVTQCHWTIIEQSHLLVAVGLSVMGHWGCFCLFLLLFLSSLSLE